MSAQIWFLAQSDLQRLGADIHKWMISVDTPSYVRLAISQYPMLTSLVSGTNNDRPAKPYADTPCLPCVELAFSGTSVGGAQQKLMLEHWVELDRMQNPSVVLGEEQIVDVELDRGTLFSRSRVVENAAAAAGPVAGNVKDERETQNTLPKVKILGGM
ncbi:hypothetical protein B0H10DRAFT_2220901 [Mycena sp. CBHHK59/15]|nr:hypothetical protein B0H10DRAFT_2220901 [Mycena sp. CBHHK59/15]